MTDDIEQINWVYTPRAFRQDAEEAMRGNIVRGLIELITNADDAYTKMEAQHGRIRVGVEHRRGREWRVIARDRATGMSLQELRERIVHLGKRSSGFESGRHVRGNRGRGAKDLAAFGRVRFESINDGRYAQLEAGATTVGVSKKDEPATREIRESLGIPRGNGTVVTMLVNPSIRCPLHDRLRDQLARHYQLRFITMDPTRELVLVNLNNPNEATRLRYEVDWTGHP